MEKSCPPSTTPEDSAPPNPSPNKDHFQYLNQLNQISHKISKAPFRKPSSFAHLSLPHESIFIDDDDDPQSQPSNLHHQHQQQPPVYNINKNDFRDVVQKLTGSPAHDERLSMPPPIQPPKLPSSRLQRIRPPPLAHLSNRPPPLLNDAVGLAVNPSSSVVGGSFLGSQQPVHQPFSPLPPLPAVLAAAESPVSAYMRYLHASYKRKPETGEGSELFGACQPPALNNSLPSPASGSVLTTLFGCLPLSPGSLFSAVNQFSFQQLPLSPTPPVSSRRWKKGQ